MPPKLTRPRRSSGSSPAIVKIFPGTAKHISGCSVKRTAHGQDLPQSNSTIIRRHPTMPVRMKSRPSQADHGALGEIFILKTSAGQDDILIAGVPGDLEDHFH